MTEFVTRAGIEADPQLAAFIETDVLGPLGRDVDAFWKGFADLLGRFGPRNADLLARREDLQAKIDAWHTERAGQPHEAGAYRTFLEDIGYLVPEPGEFTIGTENVDPEIATMAGPQLVVPILNARFLLNAANARWGSLYDALYGTDALNSLPQGKGYDEARGAQVIAWGRKHLDEVAPLDGISWADIDRIEVKGGTLCSGEVVYELDNYSGGFDRGPACGLGDFVPVEYADKVSDAPMIMGE